MDCKNYIYKNISELHWFDNMCVGQRLFQNSIKISESGVIELSIWGQIYAFQKGEIPLEGGGLELF